MTCVVPLAAKYTLSLHRYILGFLVRAGPPAVQQSAATQSPCRVAAGYGSGIYNSAKNYQQSGIGQSQYRKDLGNALSSSGASASAAASGDLLSQIVAAAVDAVLPIHQTAAIAQQQCKVFPGLCTQHWQWHVSFCAIAHSVTHLTKPAGKLSKG